MYGALHLFYSWTRMCTNYRLLVCVTYICISVSAHAPTFSFSKIIPLIFVTQHPSYLTFFSITYNSYDWTPDFSRYKIYLGTRWNALRLSETKTLPYAIPIDRVLLSRNGYARCFARIAPISVSFNTEMFVKLA